MSKKIYIAMITIIIIGVFIFIVTLPQEVENTTVSKEENKVGENTVQTIEEDSQEKIEIQDIDGKGRNYIFTYKDEEYQATYTNDNWHIQDSYKITQYRDILRICKILARQHPIHTQDLKGYRKAEDMAQEWIQHNLVYQLLPEETDVSRSRASLLLPLSEALQCLLSPFPGNPGRLHNGPRRLGQSSRHAESLSTCSF